MSRGTLDPAGFLSGFAYGAFTLSGRPSQAFLLPCGNSLRSPNPGVHALRFGLFRFRSPLLPESFFIFSSSGYLDVSVHRVPSAGLWIYPAVAGLSPAGFPHSDIHGSLPVCGSPWLFAAYRVFRRLLVPRHPPCALSCLTSLSAPSVALWSLTVRSLLSSEDSTFQSD